MKKVTMWMLILAMAVSPVLAQEADSTNNEKQQTSEEEQVDQAIQEATGGVWVDEAVDGQAPAPAAESVKGLHECEAAMMKILRS